MNEQLLKQIAQYNTMMMADGVSDAKFAKLSDLIIALTAKLQPETTAAPAGPAGPTGTPAPAGIQNGTDGLKALFSGVQPVANQAPVVNAAAELAKQRYAEAMKYRMETSDDQYCTKQQALIAAQNVADKLTHESVGVVQLGNAGGLLERTAFYLVFPNGHRTNAGIAYFAFSPQADPGYQGGNFDSILNLAHAMPPDTGYLAEHGEEIQWVNPKAS